MLCLQIGSLGSLEQVVRQNADAAALEEKDASPTMPRWSQEPSSPGAMPHHRPHAPLQLAETFHDCAFLFAKVGGLSQLVNDPVTSRTDSTTWGHA